MTNLDKKTDEIPYYCSECGGRIIQNYREAELTCSNCGLVIRTQIFLKGPEWREFDTEQKEKRCRVGDPFTCTIHDYGLATIISEKNRDYLGRVLSQKYNSQIYRLRKLDKQYRYTNSSQKSMMKAFTELERLESSINLPISRKIKEEAAILYRKLLEKGLTKGRSIDLIITTILYITCRQNGLPITLKDICQNSKFSEKSINRMYRLNIDLVSGYYLYDDFDDLSLEGRTPMYGIYKNMLRQIVPLWTIEQGSPIIRNGNLFLHHNGSSSPIVTALSSVVVGTWELRVKLSSGVSSGVFIFRPIYQDGSNFYQLQITGAGSILFQQNKAGSYTDYISFSQRDVFAVQMKRKTLSLNP